MWEITVSDELDVHQSKQIQNSAARKTIVNITLKIHDKKFIFASFIS